MADLDQEQLFGTSIGERLRAAREERKLSLKDVASQTRIPIRHLEHIESGDWDALPAATYSVGFVRAYGNAVGLDGPALGAELREQLGGLPRGQTHMPAYYEPADPSRVPPRSLALVALLIAVALVVGYLIFRSNAVDDPGVDESAITEGPAAPAQPAARPAGPPASAASGPVVIAANEEVWLRIYEASGTSLYQGIMRPGERYEVPAGANAPMIHTGRPNVLQITVGGAAIPPLGPPEQRVTGVSLKPADLLARASGASASGTVPAPPPTNVPPPPVED